MCLEITIKTQFLQLTGVNNQAVPTLYRNTEILVCNTPI